VYFEEPVVGFTLQPTLMSPPAATTTATTTATAPAVAAAALARATTAVAPPSSQLGQPRAGAVEVPRTVVRTLTLTFFLQDSSVAMHELKVGVERKRFAALCGQAVSVSVSVTNHGTW
jgi:hypothetical protein